MSMRQWSNLKPKVNEKYLGNLYIKKIQLTSSYFNAVMEPQMPLLIYVIPESKSIIT